MVSVALSAASLDAASILLDALATRPPAHALPGPLYYDPAVFDLDVAHVWHREWVFAGHACELRDPGDYLTLTVGACPLIVVRGHDGALRALHKVSCAYRSDGWWGITKRGGR